MSSQCQPSTLPNLLTEREFQVVILVSLGYKNCEIGRHLGTTEHVIKNYLRSIFDKVGCWNRVELALRYVHEEIEQLNSNRSETESLPTPADIAQHQPAYTL